MTPSELRAAAEVVMQKPTVANRYDAAADNLARHILATVRDDDGEPVMDDPETDCTDAAHPAWWRGNDHAVAVMCQQVNAILDTGDVSGTCSEPWESTRKRLASLRKQAETNHTLRAELAALREKLIAKNDTIKSLLKSVDFWRDCYADSA